MSSKFKAGDILRYEGGYVIAGDHLIIGEEYEVLQSEHPELFIGDEQYKDGSDLTPLTIYKEEEGYFLKVGKKNE